MTNTQGRVTAVMLLQHRTTHWQRQLSGYWSMLQKINRKLTTAQS